MSSSLTRLLKILLLAATLGLVLPASGAIGAKTEKEGATRSPRRGERARGKSYTLTRRRDYTKGIRLQASGIRIPLQTNVGPEGYAGGTLMSHGSHSVSRNG